MLSSPTLTNILLIIVLVINVITMVVVIISMKKNHKQEMGLVKEYPVTSVQSNLGIDGGSQGLGYADTGIVFCRSCGAQYDSANSACPRCKTPR